MKKYILFFILIIGILMSTTACAAAGVGSTNTQKQIYVNGTGQVFLTPDVVYVYIGVRSESEDVSNALRENNIQTEAVADALKENNVDPADIQTSAFNVYPQPKYDMQGEITETTYNVENTIYVTIRDLQNLGKVLDEVIKAGANNINGVEFDVLDKSEALTEARALAIKNAKSQAQELASAADVELGDLISLSVYANNMPYASYEGKAIGGAMAPEVLIAAGQLTIQATADLIYEIK